MGWYLYDHSNVDLYRSESSIMHVGLVISCRIKAEYCPNFALCEYMSVSDKSRIILKRSSWLLHLLFLKMSGKQLSPYMCARTCMGVCTQQWSKDCTQDKLSSDIVSSAKVQRSLYTKAAWSSGLRFEPRVMFYSNSRESDIRAKRTFKVNTKTLGPSWQTKLRFVLGGRLKG